MSKQNILPLVFLSFLFLSFFFIIIYYSYFYFFHLLCMFIVSSILSHLKSTWSMVLIFDGNSEIGMHLRSDIGSIEGTCLDRLKSQIRKLLLKKHLIPSHVCSWVLRHHLIYLPWHNLLNSSNEPTRNIISLAIKWNPKWLLTAVYVGYLIVCNRTPQLYVSLCMVKKMY